MTFVACPLCARKFPARAIEAHAASCRGSHADSPEAAEAPNAFAVLMMNAKAKKQKTVVAAASALEDIDDDDAAEEQRPNAFSLLMTNAAKRPPEECL